MNFAFLKGLEGGGATWKRGMVWVARGKKVFSDATESVFLYSTNYFIINSYMD